MEFKFLLPRLRERKRDKEKERREGKGVVGGKHYARMQHSEFSTLRFLAYYMKLSKSFYFSDPQFLPLQNGSYIPIHFIG